MSTLKTHNLQSPDSGSVNILMTPNAGMVVTGISTFNDRINIGSLGVTTNFTVAGISTFSGQLNVGSNIKLGTAGVVTATSFVGSGANLTSLPAANLTGTLPAISGANLTGITTTIIHNNGNKKVIIGTSTSNTLEADSGVFIGQTGKLSIGNVVATGQIGNYSLDIKGDGTNAYIDLGDPFPSFSAGQFPTARLKTVDANKTLELQSMYGGDNVLYKHIELSGNNTIFYRGDNVNTEIGRWTLNGLTFNGDTAAANSLDDYEEGSWTPVLQYFSGGWQDVTMTTYGNLDTPRYVKIGRLVHATFNWSGFQINGSHLAYPRARGLPFTSTAYGSCVVSYHNCFGNTQTQGGWLANGQVSFEFYHNGGSWNSWAGGSGRYFQVSCTYQAT